MMHVGDIMSTARGIFTIVTLMDHLSTVWSVIHVWDPPLKQLPSHTTASLLALCGASYGTHLKGDFGQLPLYRHRSRHLGYHVGPTFTSVFGQLPHCHHYSWYRVELHMRPA